MTVHKFLDIYAWVHYIYSVVDKVWVFFTQVLGFSVLAFSDYNMYFGLFEFSFNIMPLSSITVTKIKG